ncbi:hypothetical protein L7F22_046551 [Adiantum nelumboides]|nr:hypothetical protein [Adiantum nelumboides]
MTTLRTILGLVAIEDIKLVQMDVKIAFLHEDLDDNVYMQQLEGFVHKDTRHWELVCKLKKAHYGLKKGLRQWYHKVDACMRSQGYKRSKEDHTACTPNS